MTTIVLVRKNNEVVVAGDGQVSMGNTVVKSTASKVRKIEKRGVVAGFAGSTADALTLFERLEAKLEKHAGNLSRAAVELAKDWRTDKYLRRLEALMAVGDKSNSYIISGTGDVLEPEGDVIGIGSGGNYALAAGKVLMEGNMSAEEVAKKAIKVAADICVFTNENIKVENYIKGIKYAAAIMENFSKYRSYKQLVCLLKCYPFANRSRDVIKKVGQLNECRSLLSYLKQLKRV